MKYGLTKIASYGLSIVGVLTLIEDLDWVNLRSNIGDWTEAYRDAVSSLFDPLYRLVGLGEMRWMDRWFLRILLRDQNVERTGGIALWEDGWDERCEPVLGGGMPSECGVQGNWSSASDEAFFRAVESGELTSEITASERAMISLVFVVALLTAKAVAIPVARRLAGVAFERGGAEEAQTDANLQRAQGCGGCLGALVGSGVGWVFGAFWASVVLAMAVVNDWLAFTRIPEVREEYAWAEWVGYLEGLPAYTTLIVVAMTLTIGLFISFDSQSEELGMKLLETSEYVRFLTIGAGLVLSLVLADFVIGTAGQ